jgi:16S rRNA (guanine(966)-N(2))-methyltransferase RsmD
VLFDIIGGSIEGAPVLDLFAGVGAVGIEALSRGAAEGCFIEKDPGALRLLRANIEVLGLASRCRILAASVGSGIRVLEEEGKSFLYVFADPPYAQADRDWIRRAFRSGPGGLLAADGVFVLEASKHSAQITDMLGGLRRYRTHSVGETNLFFYSWEAQ